MPRSLIVFMAGFVVIVAISLGLLAAGSTDAAHVAGYIGPLAWCLGFGLYVVLFDSGKHWPGVSAFQRYARYITFYRD